MSNYPRLRSRSRGPTPPWRRRDRPYRRCEGKRVAGELTAMLQAQANAEAPLERMNVLRESLKGIWQKPAEEAVCCCAQPRPLLPSASGEEPLIREATATEQAAAAAAVEEESEAEEILIEQPGEDSPVWSNTSEDENVTENDAEDTPVITLKVAAVPPPTSEVPAIPQVDDETPAWNPAPLKPAPATEIDGETPAWGGAALAMPQLNATEEETTPQATVWFRRILRRLARIERRR